MIDTIQKCEEDLLNFFETQIERAENIKDQYIEFDFDSLDSSLGKIFTINYELEGKL